MFISMEICTVACGLSSDGSARIGRTGLHLCTTHWDITLASRTGADDVLQCWDAGAVAYDRWGHNEKSLRLPFMGIIWSRRA